MQITGVTKKTGIHRYNRQYNDDVVRFTVETVQWDGVLRRDLVSLLSNPDKYIDILAQYFSEQEACEYFDVFVKKLEEKLDKGRNHPFVETTYNAVGGDVQLLQYPDDPYTYYVRGKLIDEKILIPAMRLPKGKPHPRSQARKALERELQQGKVKVYKLSESQLETLKRVNS